MSFPKSESFVAFAGRNLKCSRSPTTLEKTNCDFTSIPGFVIEKNSSRGPKHGVSERQVMFYRAKEMLKKARQTKHRNHPTILSRRYEQEDTESHCRSTILAKRKSCFSIASLLKDTTLQLTKAKRLQNAKDWTLRLNADGLKSLFDSDQNLSLHQNNALKCKMLTWRKRNNL